MIISTHKLRQQIFHSGFKREKERADVTRKKKLKKMRNGCAALAAFGQQPKIRRSDNLKQSNVGLTGNIQVTVTYCSVNECINVHINHY